MLAMAGTLSVWFMAILSQCLAIFISNTFEVPGVDPDRTLIVPGRSSHHAADLTNVISISPNFHHSKNIRVCGIEAMHLGARLEIGRQPRLGCLPGKEAGEPEGLMSYRHDIGI